MEAETHVSEFVCNNCNREFKRHASLTKHVRSKTCTRSKVCPRCEVEFADQYSLKRHLARKYKCLPVIQQNDCVCPGCGNEYSDRSGMFRHYRLRCRNRDAVEEELTCIDTQQKTPEQQKTPQRQLVNFGMEDLKELDIDEVYDAMMNGVDAVLVNFLDLMLEYDTIRYDTAQDCIVTRTGPNSWEQTELSDIIDVTSDEVSEYIMEYQPRLAEVAICHNELAKFCNIVPCLINGPEVHEPIDEELNRALTLIREHPL